MSDTTITDQAAGIKAALDRVPDIGVTFDHQPVPRNDLKAFVALYTASIDGVRQVRAWTVQYIGEERVDRVVAVGATKTHRALRWVIRGHLAWKVEDSDKTFRELIEGVVHELDSDRSLGGSAIMHDPVRVDLPGDGAGVVFGDVAVHYCEIALRATAQDTLATH